MQRLVNMPVRMKSGTRGFQLRSTASNPLKSSTTLLLVKRVFVIADNTPLPRMSKEVEYEIGLDANDATLKTIEEQLESDSPLWQTEGAHKVCIAPRVSSSFAVTHALQQLVYNSRDVLCSFSAWPETNSSLHQQMAYIY